MNLAEYLPPDRVLLLKGRTKADALAELADVLGEAGLGVGREELREAIWKREGIMSTGIGQGLAVPHVRMPGVKTAAVAVGISPEGIADYESLDNQPVHLIVMIVAPEDEHETYLRLLAEIMQAVKDPELRRRIIQAPDTQTAHSLLVER